MNQQRTCKNLELDPLRKPKFMRSLVRVQDKVLESADLLPTVLECTAASSKSAQHVQSPALSLSAFCILWCILI